MFSDGFKVAPATPVVGAWSKTIFAAAAGAMVTAAVVTEVNAPSVAVIV